MDVGYIAMDVLTAAVYLVQLDLQVLVNQLVAVQQLVQSRYGPLLVITATLHYLIIISTTTRKMYFTFLFQYLRPNLLVYFPLF